MSSDRVPLAAKQFVLEFTDKLPNALVIHQHKHQVIAVSRKVSDITGIQVNANLAELRSLGKALSSADHKLVTGHWKALQSGKDFVEFEVCWQGKTKLHQLCISALEVLNGEYVVVFADDITDAKDHENYLVEFGTKKNTTLDSILHFVSGAITLTQHFYIEAGKNLEHSDTKNLKELLELINRNSQHCLDIINSVTRSEYDKSPLIAQKNTRINLAENLQYILENLILAYPKRQFHLRVEDASLSTEADGFKLLQIINNLVFNAIKFSGMDQPVELNVYAENDQVVISVGDRGIGIPVELQAYIFDRHTIAGRAGLNGEPSHGIGLSICKQLATQMGGRIWFTSSLESGSVFYLALPRSN